MLLRGQLLQTMSDQQNLMDALTSVSTVYTVFTWLNAIAFITLIY